MKRLVVVCHPLLMGGTEKTIVELTRELSKKYSITIVILATDRQSKREFYSVDKSINKIVIPKTANVLSYISMLIKLKQAITSINPELIISFLTIPSILTLLACNIQSNKVIVAERTDPKYTPNLSLHWRLLRFATYIILLKKLVVQSEMVAKSFPYVRRSRINIIPNACKLGTRTTSKESKQSQENNKRLNLLYIGRFDYQKGVDLLLKALKLMRDEIPEIDLKLTVVGDGSQRGSYQKMIREYNLSCSVNIKPAAKNESEVIGYMRNSDFIIIPSRWEGLPNVLIEALAVGKPVIVTKQASSGYITDEINGIIINSCTASAVKYCLHKAYKINRNNMSMEKEILLTAKHFDPKVVYQKWYSLLSDTMHK